MFHRERIGTNIAKVEFVRTHEDILSGYTTLADGLAHLYFVAVTTSGVDVPAQKNVVQPMSIVQCEA